MIETNHLRLPFSLVAFLISGVYASLPYTPTTIFASKNASNKRTYYILDSPSPSYPSGRLASFSASSTLDSTELPLDTLTSSLPFLRKDPSLSYVSTQHSDGSLAVLAGKCSEATSKAQLWIYSPDASGDAATWRSQSVSIAASDDSSSSGVQYLGSALSYTFNTQDADNIYTFGGMCPDDSSIEETWTVDATYSNELLTIRQNSGSYTAITSDGQPTPEAGFSLTPLLPTFTNNTDGSQTQQQDFILIGGHTQEAFIDMSTIALFSLPQSSWAFLPVSSSASSNDLTVKRQSPRITPRSGHSAVLSSDGSKILVFGGWVGNVSTPATPQLLTLEVAAGFGGAGEWAWSTSGSSPFQQQDGIYGHGAAMLEGDIMMVTGGYDIQSQSISGKVRKRAVQTTGGRNFFLNVTSGNWIDSYKPNSVEDSMSMDHAGGLLQTENQKAGLGAGLAIGLIALICIIVFSTLYYKKLKRQREHHADAAWEDREKEIEDLSKVAFDPAAGYASQDDRYGGNKSLGANTSQFGSAFSAYPWAYNESSTSNVRDAERSGLYLDIPSPKRGLRRSMYGKGQYHSAPRYDDGRAGYSGRDMHAIQERDEENSTASSSRKASSTQRPDLTVDTAIAANVDPFRDPDPTLDAHVPARTLRRVPTRVRSPPVAVQSTPAEDRQREMSGWIRDWAAAGAGPRSVAAERYSPVKSGRSSPSKSDRTRSDLSERSVRSHVSSTGLLPSRGPSSRSAMRTYLPSILPTALTNAFTSPTSASALEENMYGSSSSGPSDGSSDDRTSSFTTAQTTITQLQAESEALLGHPAPVPLSRSRNFSFTHSRTNSGNVLANPRGTETSDLVPDSEPTFRLPRSASQISPTRSRHASLVGGWVGSVKRGVTRAVTGSRTVSLTSDLVRYPRPTVIGGDGYYDYTPTIVRPGDGEDAVSKRERSDLGGLVDLTDTNLGHPYSAARSANARKEKVRRSVSEGGATFWQTKRGAKDWEFEPIPSRINKKNPSLVPSKSHRAASASHANGATSAGAAAGASKNTGALSAFQPPRSAGIESVFTQADSINTAETEDWDVEKAVEERMVQVMFTVPREKLRVVNADVDALSLASKEERAEIVQVDDDEDTDAKARTRSRSQSLQPVTSGVSEHSDGTEVARKRDKVLPALPAGVSDASSNNDTTSSGRVKEQVRRLEGSTSRERDESPTPAPRRKGKGRAE